MGFQNFPHFFILSNKSVGKFKLQSPFNKSSGSWNRNYTIPTPPFVFFFFSVKLKFHTFPHFFNKKCWKLLSNFMSGKSSIFPQCAQWSLEGWNVIFVTWRTSPSGKRTLMRQNRYFLLSFISSLSLMALVRSIVSRSANSDLKRREQKIGINFRMHPLFNERTTHEKRSSSFYRSEKKRIFTNKKLVQCIS